MSAVTDGGVTVSFAEARALKELVAPALATIVAEGECEIAEAKMKIFKASQTITTERKKIEVWEHHLLKVRIAQGALERMP